MALPRVHVLSSPTNTFLRNLYNPQVCQTEVDIHSMGTHVSVIPQGRCMVYIWFGDQTQKLPVSKSSMKSAVLITWTNMFCTPCYSDQAWRHCRTTKDQGQMPQIVLAIFYTSSIGSSIQFVFKLSGYVEVPLLCMVSQVKYKGSSHNHDNCGGPRLTNIWSTCILHSLYALTLTFWVYIKT
jgi:hypothetical protein